VFVALSANENHTACVSQVFYNIILALYVRNDALVSEEKCFTNKKILLLYPHHVYIKHSMDIHVMLSSVI